MFMCLFVYGSVHVIRYVTQITYIVSRKLRTGGPRLAAGRSANVITAITSLPCGFTIVNNVNRVGR